MSTVKFAEEETVVEPVVAAVAEPKFPPHPDVSRILGNIYISGIQPIVDHAPLKAQYGITHILSVIRFNIIPEYLVRKGYTLKNISIDDIPQENILQYFNETNKFIDECLFPNELEYDPNLVSFKKKAQKNGILIHCQAGESRSVAFVTAYLMYRYGLKLNQALYAIKRKRPSVKPNDGFLKQLKLYESMGSPQIIDYSNDKLYKIWKLENMSLQENFQIEKNFYKEGNDEDLELKKLNNDDLKNVTVVRCKKCRHRLALSTSFIPHIPPSKDSSESHFIRKAANSNRVIDIQESQDTCSHYFMEPLKWMEPELSKQELEGKLTCPNCEMKVGAYNWKGSRCSCGKWVTPAIHLQSNRVDQFPLNKVALPNIVNFKQRE
ncbi:similar to Saccharomyces cerevisiae YIR026C YVH1 Protein phosphatase involved in vegetative growth at low temperatures, sporulation, and glycogen accumulation [Maudiozyma saulgeensis]|uniref:protein-tyrosine-phosphatase n=1 Tax=Maudiozyma saulgeensis TaxID=1789683 RepID=A0A1X7RBL0_9SACH|nr:similar to Saccharomyces cerevisiae YIR026C YVH1 Protein phosphatase involved in vegetative growth at low temperatures, sporulation, and glycogen accumulation [Kazachstania saulgeensis]